jgi:hypothetical protein
VDNPIGRGDNVSTIFRVEKNQNFVVMSNHHLRNKDMSLKSKGLLSLILSLPPEWNYSLAGLCAICKESQTAMRSALKELETHKYLVRKRQKNALGQFEYEYVVYEIPHTENQYAAKVDAVPAYTENSSQISKEELSINELNINIENKEKEKADIDSLLMDVGNADLIELYWQYIDLRKDMKCPLNPRSLKMLITRAKKLSQNNIMVEKLLLENAIINGWKNVFLPKESELNNVSGELAKDLRAFFNLES